MTKSKKYRRLCAEDRKVIYNINKAGFGQAEIGEFIGFGQPTVSKELSRNKGKRLSIQAGSRSREGETEA
ncbi:MAG: helix-turn-helix domain-containing protein [Verrucomicrobiales bacterium]